MVQLQYISREIWEKVRAMVLSTLITSSRTCFVCSDGAISTIVQNTNTHQTYTLFVIFAVSNNTFKRICFYLFKFNKEKNEKVFGFLSI